MRPYGGGGLLAWSNGEKRQLRERKESASTYGSGMYFREATWDREKGNRREGALPRAKA